MALVLIALLAGTLVPSVLNQLGKGEVNRIVEDVGALGQGTKSFRLDVNRWPGDLEDLVQRPSGAGDTDLNAAAYPGSLTNRWNGPYLEVGMIKGDSLLTGRGGVVRNAFTKTSWGGKDFLTITVAGLTKEDVQAVSVIIDGDTVVDNATADDNGRVRWAAGPPGEMLYLVAPVN